MYKLLMIDDDKEVLDLMSQNFFDHGYDVRCAQSAEQGLALFDYFCPECVLLDVMMPGMNGFDACKEIRKKSNVPILFLTGRVLEDDKVLGLLLGADDYIEKPYSFRELEARVLANIRRSKATSMPASDRLSFPPLEVDVASHRVFCNGKNLNLSNQEYDLLYCLIERRGTLVTYEQLGLQMWGSYHTEDRQNMMVGVSRLRKKMEHDPVAARMIETVWSQGYRFVGKRKES